MKCPVCRTGEVLQYNFGKCDKCIEISRTCTECGELVNPSAVYVKTEGSREVGRGHKECIDLLSTLPQKNMISADHQFDPVQVLNAWANAMSNKLSQGPVLKLIKMRPEVFESLKNDIPIESRSGMSNVQISQYVGISFEIVPDLKTNIEYIYH